MKTLKQTSNEIEVGTQFVFKSEPTALDSVFAAIKLEARMLVFDTLHGTDYRSIRHALVAEQKRRDFEASIGLVSASARKRLR